MAQNKVLKSEFRISIVELPELAIEIILERLTPPDLCMMSCVCKLLREICCSDHLWEKHMKRKWGKVIGEAAHRDWLKYTEPSNYPKTANRNITTTAQSSASIKNWFLLLESGKFWFSAQVYMSSQQYSLSCYDAIISYDPLTNSFRARYPSYDEQEEGISWDRIRVPQTDNLPHNIHISDRRDDLQPGDHVEVQWRIRKREAYGWWYGVVAHLESCRGNDKQCCCSSSDRVLIEFKQYSLQSRWRKATIPMKNRNEFIMDQEGGFYGGIRKLYNVADISMWKKFWPNEDLS